MFMSAPQERILKAQVPCSHVSYHPSNRTNFFWSASAVETLTPLWLEHPSWPLEEGLAKRLAWWDPTEPDPWPDDPEGWYEENP